MLPEKRSFSCFIITVFLVIAMMFCPILDTVSVLLAHPRDNCEAELEEAENKYRLGRLDEVIALVNQCLNKEGMSSIEENGQAYKLLGKAYYAKGLLTQTRENLRKLLELIPNWRPNPEVDTPSFIRLADEVIREKEAELKARQVEEEARKAEEEAQRKAEAEKKRRKPAVKKPLPPAVPAQLKKGSSKKFLWIGLAVAAVGGGLVIALKGGDSGTTGVSKLPDPPGGPGSN